MSAFVLEKNEIDTLTQATAAALQLNKKYRLSYPLAAETVEILGKYADDLHNLYRILFITNLKAVNGRYGEYNKTFPKYTTLKPWNISDTYWIDGDALRKACGLFGCYMYQIAEDPICDQPIFNAIADVYKLLSMLYFIKYHDWDGNSN